MKSLDKADWRLIGKCDISAGSVYGRAADGGMGNISVGRSTKMTVSPHSMFETLSTMPDELKPAATNRVAQYMYFAIWCVTDSQGWQDIELSRFIPAYSNSLQWPSPPEVNARTPCVYFWRRRSPM